MTLAVVLSAVALACYIALVFVTIRQSLRIRTNQAFVLYLAAMTFWQFTALMVSLSKDAASAFFWYKLMTAGLGGQFIFHLFFTLIFLGMERQRSLFYAGWLVFIALLASSGTNLVIEKVSKSEVTGLYVPHFGLLVPAVGISAYFFLGYGAYILVRGYRRTKSELQRNRLRYLLIGVSVITIGSLSNLVPAFRAYPVDVAANVVNACLIAYVIFRYQLLDITVVIRRGLAYSIPTAIIGTSYFLILFLATSYLHLATGGAFLLSLVIAAVMAVAMRPVWDRMQSRLDRLFFREKYDAGLMLQRLSRTAAAVLDLDTLTSMILDKITATMHVKKAAFLLKQEGKGGLRLVAQRGLDQHADMRLRQDQPLVEWFREHESDLIRQDLEVLPQFKALWSREREVLQEIEAELYVPLLLRDELIGMLILGPKLSETAYTVDERRVLLTLANQIAVAIENARLFSLEQRKAEEFATLLDIAQAVGSTLDLPPLLRMIAQKTAAACGADRCTILLLDEKGRRLVPLMSQFRDGHRDGELWQSFQEKTYIEEVDDVPLLTRVLKERRPVILAEDSLSLLPSRWIEPFGIKSLLAVPLISKDTVMGLMVLDHMEEGARFGDDQVNLATTIGSQVATAVENARLYEQTIKEKERTATVVEQAFAGIIVLDAEMRIVALNPAAEAVIGYPAEEARGRYLPDICCTEHFREGGALSKALAAGGWMAPVEVSIVGRGGSRDLLLGMVPLGDGYLLSFTDVTRLKEVDRLKSGIVANVSHELRTPLASIKAYTELLLEGLEGEDGALRKRFLAVINEETDKLAELIGNLLDLSRLEAGRLEVRGEHLAVAEILREVVASLDVQAREKGVTVHLDLPADLHPLWADREMMKTVVRNLLSNAIKFSREGGRVDLAARERAGHLVLDVVDQGVGIPKEDMPHLFEKFYRSELARRSGIVGTGLGLVLVKEAVEAHKGYIEVKSEEGVGTQCTVVLPLDYRE